jgi:hypothetical protein
MRPDFVLRVQSAMLSGDIVCGDECAWEVHACAGCSSARLET